MGPGRARQGKGLISKVDALLRAMGAREVRPKGDKVECTCLLAPWTHAGGRDSRPSMVLFEGRYGDLIYACQGCHERGAVRDLLCFIWMKTGQSTIRWIEWLDGQAEQVPEGVDVKIYRQRRRVERLSKAEVDLAALRRRAEESRGEQDGPWHDPGALQAAAEVPEISWAQYEPFVGSVPPYALQRGLTVETCREWELGHDKRGKRLLFPMRDRQGRLVAISGRRYACQYCGTKRTMKGEDKVERCVGCKREMPPKYLHSDGFKRNLCLYGEHRVQDGSACVYVVEGHLDVLKVWQAGYRPAVALLGSHPGPSQVEKLVAYYDRVMVVPDGDGAGADMASKLEAMVAWRVPVAIRKPENGKDPGELSPEELLDLLGPPTSPVSP